ncbi:hypothetical protein VNO78_03300 [Psophocarpus tetragonolobus]|uniref:Uncharacterized protein n=1 Tax=Psophocarpus tetragonolobus TaxID=3891 RepID=A0AAN9XWI7_PSOTE
MTVAEAVNRGALTRDRKKRGEKVTKKELEIGVLQKKTTPQSHKDRVLSVVKGRGYGENKENEAVPVTTQNLIETEQAATDFQYAS